MRDQRARHRALEMQALTAARVGAFVLTAGQATARDTAAVVVAMLSKLINFARSERKPFLYTIGIGGSLSLVKIR